MIKVYFNNIRKHLLTELDKAKEKISVAIFWFTNEELFEKLINKIREGLRVELIIHNDYINNRETGLPFQQFVNAGGELYFSSTISPMHNKFCLIDNKVLINGSYNWTYYAENRNKENILIIKKDQSVIDAFAEEFERLKLLTEKIDEIILLTKYEVDEFNQLSSRDYLANDLVFQAKETGRLEMVETAFQIAPDNIEVQKTAFDLDLTKKWKLKHSIGASLKDNEYLIIIPKGTMIPVSRTKIVQTTKDNQRSSTATIHFGEKPKARSNIQFEHITVNGIPPKPAGEAKLKYIFSIDIYGTLKIEKFSLDNGRKYYKTKKIISNLEEVN